ncbi:MAG: hypothetical protein V7K21_29395 [Nostoc sp.]
MTVEEAMSTTGVAAAIVEQLLLYLVLVGVSDRQVTLKVRCKSGAWEQL